MQRQQAGALVSLGLMRARHASLKSGAAPLHTPAAAAATASPSATQPSSPQRAHLLLVDAVEVLHQLQRKGTHLGVQPSLSGSSSLVLVKCLMALWLDALTKHQPPTHAIVAMDYPLGITFRHTLLPIYRASHCRSPHPVELWEAVMLLHHLFRALQVRVIRTPGIEADDIIATLATRARAHDMEVSILSPDTSFFQLLQPRVKLLRRCHDQDPPFFDANDLLMDHGIRPEHWLDFMALTGDASTNVPGLPKVGERGAKYLIQQYKTLEGVLEHASEVERKAMREELCKPETAIALKFSRSLLALRTGLQLPGCWLPWATCRVQLPDLQSPQLQFLFAQCGMPSGPNSIFEQLQAVQARQRMQHPHKATHPTLGARTM